MLDDGYLIPHGDINGKKIQKQSHSICVYKKISLFGTSGIHL